MVPVQRNAPNHAALAPMNRLETIFDRVFGEEGAHAHVGVGMPLSVWQDDDHLYVEADLPGLSEGDVDVTVHRGVLQICGERKRVEGRRPLYDSRAYGRFERTIQLPETVDLENVQARMKDGILSLILPKRPESRPRRVQVQVD